jgi:hypothetical protein
MANDKYEKLITERGSQYGDAEDQWTTSQMLKSICHTSPNWETMPELHKEALDMICLKMSRILVGDFNHMDHWDDIIGYAKVVSDRL